MSGGHWNYSDRLMIDLSEQLEDDPDEAVQLLGKVIRRLAVYVRSADYWYSGDSDDWLDEREAIMKRLRHAEAALAESPAREPGSAS